MSTSIKRKREDGEQDEQEQPVDDQLQPPVAKEEEKEDPALFAQPRAKSFVFFNPKTKKPELLEFNPGNLVYGAPESNSFGCSIPMTYHVVIPDQKIDSYEPVRLQFPSLPAVRQISQFVPKGGAEKKGEKKSATWTLDLSLYGYNKYPGINGYSAEAQSAFLTLWDLDQANLQAAKQNAIESAKPAGPGRPAVKSWFVKKVHPDFIETCYNANTKKAAGTNKETGLPITYPPNLSAKVFKFGDSKAILLDADDKSVSLDKINTKAMITPVIEYKGLYLKDLGISCKGTLAQASLDKEAPKRVPLLVK